MFENDLEYRKLKADYDKVKNEYVIAVLHRNRVRKMLRKQRTEKRPERRPVGAPENIVIPPEQVVSGMQGLKKEKDFRINLGPILGWITLVLSTNPLPMDDPMADFNVDDTFDQVSLGIYWNAKTPYLRCKEALKRYVPKEKFVREEIASHNNLAREVLNREAYRQLLGLDYHESDFDDARREIEESCKVALAFYRSSPEPKSRGVIIMLLENLADSQFIGLESETKNEMLKELYILENKGRLTRE